MDLQSMLEEDLKGRDRRFLGGFPALFMCCLGEVIFAVILIVLFGI